MHHGCFSCDSPTSMSLKHWYLQKMSWLLLLRLAGYLAVPMCYLVPSDIFCLRPKLGKKHPYCGLSMIIMIHTGSHRRHGHRKVKRLRLRCMHFPFFQNNNKFQLPISMCTSDVGYYVGMDPWLIHPRIALQNEGELASLEEIFLNARIGALRVVAIAEPPGNWRWQGSSDMLPTCVENISQNSGRMEISWDIYSRYL